MKVLVLEPRKVNAESMKLIYASVGHEAILIDSIDDVFNWNKENKPKAVHLTGFNGCWHLAYDKLKQENPNAKYFLVSADDRKYEANAKGLDFIPKESDLEVFIQYFKKL